MILQSKRQRRWLGILILVVIIGLVVLPSDSGPVAYFRSQARVTALEASIDSLDQLVYHFEQKIEALENEEPLAIEQEARRLGFIYPGETVYEFQMKSEETDGE
jgi:cell division protein FtsB